jgi:uncharacterized protein (TIGR02118 family)
VYKVVATWSPPAPVDVSEFERYYREVHVPLAAKVPELRGLVLTRTDVGLEGAKPAFYRVAELRFDSREALERSSRSPAWEAMRADARKMIERFGVTLSVGVGEEEVVGPEGGGPA